MMFDYTANWAFLWSEVLPLGILSWLYGCLILKAAPRFTRQDFAWKIIFSIPTAVAGHLVKVAARPYYGGSALWWDMAGFTAALVVYSMFISEKDRMTDKRISPADLFAGHCICFGIFAVFVLLSKCSEY